jgi:hypothetical protein
MPVIATTLATDWESPRSHPMVRRLLSAVLPTASAETDRVLPSVRLWWVEVNDAGAPQREVAFGEGDQVLIASPLGETLGFWTDSSMTFKPDEYPSVSQEAFDAHFARFESAWWERQSGAA